MLKSFKDMEVWQAAIGVAEEVFWLTKDLPKKEDYGLTSQIRRSANSVAANIAEGFGRRHSLDKRKFYDYARGSAFETQSHLIYGTRVQYFESTKVEALIKQLDDVIYDLNKISKALEGG